MTREEAIERLNIHKSTNVFVDSIAEAIDMAIEALSNKPTDEWCSDCKEYDHEKHCCPRFNRVIRTTLNEAVANLKEEFESAECEDYEHATLVDIKEPLKVLVVRCKDCRHYGIGNCYMYGGQMNEDDFCSYGERKK